MLKARRVIRIILVWEISELPTSIHLSLTQIGVSFCFAHLLAEIYFDRL